ncbi:MAG: helix-turn-helix domain-containing protein [Eubacteriales bacterium]|jgi:excisionase family DNA binding protein|nr:helix-turn-helix domain-containing protein [Eubacteriales bacterium]
MEFMSVKDAALLWNVSKRRVQKFCEDGRIDGIRRFGRSWMIPQNAKKPADPRKFHIEKRG